MQIIRGREIVEDHWQHVLDAEDMLETPDLPQGNIIVSPSRWRGQRNTLLARDSDLGLRLGAQEKVDAIACDLYRFTLIALEFGVFTDGRGYSQARLLRERYRYGDEIRAVGEFLPDQLFFMERCGIDAFEIPEGQDIRQALRAFLEITVVYQPAADGQALCRQVPRTHASP